MISSEVRLEYESKSRGELRLSARFARSAQREVARGNFKVALTQAMEAEKHILEAKVLLRGLNQLSEMDKTSVDVKREIKFEEEVNEQNRKIEELEIQLAHVKEATTEEPKPEPVHEPEDEYKIKV